MRAKVMQEKNLCHTEVFVGLFKGEGIKDYKRLRYRMTDGQKHCSHKKTTPQHTILILSRDVSFHALCKGGSISLQLLGMNLALLIKTRNTRLFLCRPSTKNNA